MGNLLVLPGVTVEQAFTSTVETMPLTQEILNRYEKLSKKSSYSCDFDFNIYNMLEKRFKGEKLSVPLINKDVFSKISGKENVLLSYNYGCTNDNIYSYEKMHYSIKGQWNKPFPMPTDVTKVWQIFYTVFETKKRSKYRKMLEKREPIRLGGYIDSFMWMDRKYKVTREIVKILNHYNYPYIIETRSDLVGKDGYVDIISKDLAKIVMCFVNTNDAIVKVLEPGAPSQKRRLGCIQKLIRKGFNVQAHVNFFPIYSDGYFSKNNTDFKKSEYFSYDILENLCLHGAANVSFEMLRVSSYTVNKISSSLSFCFREFFNTQAAERDYFYSEKEVLEYKKRFENTLFHKGMKICGF